jgi:WD40 repeat protein
MSAASHARAADRTPGPFISYSRRDESFVRALVDALSQRGRDAWVDWDDIPPTAEWMREIHAGIDAAPALVFVISPDAVNSAVCAQEIDYAVAQNKRLIPVLCRGVDAASVPEPVRKLNWVELQGEPLSQEGIDKLVAALDTDLDWVRAHARLLVRAAEWQAKGRDASHLLRGADLAEFERWLTKAGRTEAPQATTLQSQYVLASGKAQNRRRRHALAAVSTALLVTAALAVYALLQSQRADRQRDAALSRLLAAQAQKNLFEAAGRRDLALLQSVAAVQLDPTTEAQESLWRALLDTDRIRKFVPMDDTLLSVALSPDGRSIAVGGFDGTLALWDARTLTLKQRVARDRGGQQAVVFSPDGRTLVSADREGLSLHDPQTGQVRSVVKDLGEGHGSSTVRLAWLPDGKTLLVTHINSPSLLMVDVSNPGQRTAVRVHERGIWDLALSPDGTTMAIAGDADNRVRLWDLATRRERPPLRGHVGGVRAVAFSRDGVLLASGDEGGGLILWNAASGSQRRVLQGQPGKIVRLAFSPDGRWLASGSNNRTVFLWDLQSDARPQVLTGHRNGLMDLAFSPDGRALYSVAFDDTLIAWNIGPPRHRVVMKDHDGGVRALALSQRGGITLATAGDDRAIRLWDLATRTLLGRLDGHRGPVRALSFSHDGAVLASGSDDDRRILLWDLASRSLLQQWETPGEVTSLAFSLDGRLLASGSENTESIVLWNAVTGARTGELAGHDGEVTALAFSPDGKRLFSGGTDQAVRTWDLATSAEAAEPMGARGTVAQIAVSHDGTRLVSSAQGPGDVLLWRLPVTEAALPFGTYPGGDARAALSPDGQVLAHVTGEFRLAIVLWSVEQRRALGKLEANASTLALAFTGDGKHLVSGHSDGDVVVWDADVGHWPQRACEIANRNLTREEWAASVGDRLPYRAPCPSLPLPKH